MTLSGTTVASSNSTVSASSTESKPPARVSAVKSSMISLDSSVSLSSMILSESTSSVSFSSVSSKTSASAWALPSSPHVSSMVNVPEVSSEVCSTSTRTSSSVTLLSSHIKLSSSAYAAPQGCTKRPAVSNIGIQLFFISNLFLIISRYFCFQFTKESSFFKDSPAFSLRIHRIFKNMAARSRMTRQPLYKLLQLFFTFLFLKTNI